MPNVVYLVLIYTMLDRALGLDPMKYLDLPLFCYLCVTSHKSLAWFGFLLFYIHDESDGNVES